MPRTVDDLQDVTGLGRDLVKASIIAGQLPGYYIAPHANSAGRYIVPDLAFERFERGEWIPIPKTIVLVSKPIDVLREAAITFLKALEKVEAEAEAEKDGK